MSPRAEPTAKPSRSARADPSDFLDWLADLRALAGDLSNADLARYLCVHEATIYRWASGDMACPDSTLQQLAGLYLQLALGDGLAELAADGNRRAFVARVARVISDPVTAAARARFERAWVNGKPGKWAGATVRDGADL